MSEPAFDKLLAAISEAGVRFVLIGGLAVNAWGVIRGTKDLDIVVDPDPENLRTLAEVAVEVGGHVLSGDSLAGSPVSIADLLASGERVDVRTRLGRIDVVQGLPGVPSYGELIKTAEEASVLGSRVHVCSLDDLRRMKQAAGRTRDLADLEDLAVAGGDD